MSTFASLVYNLETKQFLSKNYFVFQNTCESEIARLNTERYETQIQNTLRKKNTKAKNHEKENKQTNK